MRFLYDISFILFGIFYLPYLIFTRRYRYGISDRFGFLSRHLRDSISGDKVIWLHAVSVGEVKAVSILAPLLRKTFPSHRLIFSTVTHTGNKVARTIAIGEEDVFYLPFDISFVTEKVVDIIKPEIFLCLETELWPNLISSLYKRNTKIILINGRISDKSYSGYRRIRFVTSDILNKFSLILMQSKQDGDRILNLGAPKDKVFVTGNLKFDLSLVDSTNRRQEIRQRLNINEQDVLLIAGSTHRGEEMQIAECYSRLIKDYNNLRLLIAPRHIERAKEIKHILSIYGFCAIRFSVLTNDERRTTNDEIYLLDTIGDLKTIYSAGDIVFIGGSLVKKGGQNPIEPASFARPIIFGRWTFNFCDVVNTFLENQACIRVENKDELYSAIRLLLDNPEERKRLGIKAKETVHKNSGSSQLTVELILSISRT